MLFRFVLVLLVGVVAGGRSGVPILVDGCAVLALPFQTPETRRDRPKGINLITTLTWPCPVAFSVHFMRSRQLSAVTMISRSAAPGLTPQVGDRTVLGAFEAALTNCENQYP